MLRILTLTIQRSLRWATSLVVSVGLLCAVPTYGADLTAYTEEWAPYNYSEDGAIKGISTDILRSMCDAARLHCDIHMVPWARAYRNATSTANTLVYTTARKPAREREFIWIGPILPRTTWVFVRQGLERDILELADLAGLRVGVVREEAAAQDLLAAGVPTNALVHQASNADVLRMLLAASVDAMVDTEVGMQWNLRKTGASADAVRKLMKLSDEGAYYFALNLDSDPVLVRQLQGALEKLRHGGKLDAILRKYGTDALTTPTRSMPVKR